MSRIIAAVVASVCMLALATVPAPANAGPARPTVRGGGDSWCC
ncbi:MAG TPA: hypothetical protein PLP61_13040 [Nocardioides sp.]|nr:hypothetical protein [Nocardioides sp.]HQR27958.1 hypothetical protein [Nocardioides sp.]